MSYALSLAVPYVRRVLPNPCVGAVVVHNGEIIGAGCHEKYGGPHAEVNAILSVKTPSLLAQSTIYVTLEPCAHFGKTPPCVDLILRSKIPHVVVGCRDPFPAVAGRGIELLKSAGIKVTEGPLHDKCVIANKRFIIAHRFQRPYIILKWAQTHDGYIAHNSGERLLITSQSSNELVHLWRGEETAICVGKNTANNDNPLLTVRHMANFKENQIRPVNPTRVIIGNCAGMPTDLHVWNDAAPTIAFSSSSMVENNLPKNVITETINFDEPILPQVCRSLFKRSLFSVIIEGGSYTLNSFIQAGLWDEARVFTAPLKIGAGIRSPVLNHSPIFETKSGSDKLSIYQHPDLPHRLGIDSDCRYLFNPIN